MMDCWHTQLRLVATHFPEARLRPLRTWQDRIAKTGVFVYVTPTVENRLTKCPPHVVTAFREMGYTIIHVQEPRE